MADEGGWSIKQIDGKTVIAASFGVALAACISAIVVIWNASSEVTRYKVRVENIESNAAIMKGNFSELNKGVTQTIPQLLADINTKQAVTESTLKAILEEIKDRRNEERQRRDRQDR